MTASSNSHKPLRILLFGYINVNVIDGSALFLTSLTSMLVSAPEIEVDLVLANPLKRTTVLSDIIDHPSVTIIDPYQEPDPGINLSFLHSGRMTTSEAAVLLGHYWQTGSYDLVFIRSTEVGLAFAEYEPEGSHRTFLYVTGVVRGSQPLDDDLVDDFRTMVSRGMTLVCQTDEMRHHILQHSDLSIPEESLFALRPMVPDIDLTFDEVFQNRDRYTRFVYTGKFVPMWNPGKIISGFREASVDDPSMTLAVAGDQFKDDPKDPYFAKDVRYLLQNTPRVEWIGGVDRKRARELIMSSDVGISWRSKELDDSLELSTKLLEYGSFGRPCVMNRTPMHEALFGSDYPLFADSMSEYVNILKLVRDNPDVVEVAARRSFDVSAKFTFSESLRQLLPKLLAKVTGAHSKRTLNSSSVALLLTENSGGVLQTGDILFIDLSRVGTGRLLQLVMASESLEVVDSLGPVIALGLGASDPGITAAEERRAELFGEVLDFFVRDQALKMIRKESVKGNQLNDSLTSEGPTLARSASFLAKLVKDHDKLQVKFRGMHARADGYLKQAERLEEELGSMQVKYRGMHARADKYLARVGELEKRLGNPDNTR
ncbi:glycosyltransferase family protein [Arthrobacter sp. Sr33]